MSKSIIVWVLQDLNLNSRGPNEGNRRFIALGYFLYVDIFKFSETSIIQGTVQK